MPLQSKSSRTGNQSIFIHLKNITVRGDFAEAKPDMPTGPLVDHGGPSRNSATAVRVFGLAHFRTNAVGRIHVLVSPLHDLHGEDSV